LRVNENYIELKFFDFECDFEEISNKLLLTPTRTAKKGQRRSGRPDDKRIWTGNFWGYERVTKSNDYIGDHIAEFINEIILPKKDIIRELSAICEIEFSIVQYMYHGCNPGFCLDNSQLKILTEIEAELNVDIYCLSENVIHPE
jgi:hypothetical protein